MLFSSLGDWLGLLATTAMAQQLSGGDYAKANYAISGVFIARLLPAVFLGPLAGVIADKLDRRKLMVACDILRTGLYISIPIFHNYIWLYTATILVESITLFWSPAKEASIPNLVPREKLESANQVSLLAAYGTAPIAALLFIILSLFTSAINAAFSLNTTAVDLALYLNAASFAFAAFTIWGLREIPKGAAAKKSAQTGILKSLHEGWKSVSDSKIIRGLVVGMVGAFIAAGAVIGLARTFVGDLGGGEAAYGVLFGAVFSGLAAGIAFGPKVFAQFSITTFGYTPQPFWWNPLPCFGRRQKRHRSQTWCHGKNWNQQIKSHSLPLMEPRQLQHSSSSFFPCLHRQLMLPSRLIPPRLI